MCLEFDINASENDPFNPEFSLLFSPLWVHSPPSLPPLPLYGPGKSICIDLSLSLLSCFLLEVIVMKWRVGR